MSASGHKPTSFLVHVWQMASGTALGQFWLIAATPLLSRLYTPADFGMFGVFTAFIAVVSVAATLRLEMALPAAGDDAEEADLVVTILLVIVPVSLVLGALLWPLTRFDVLGLGVLPTRAAGLASVTVLAVGLSNSLRYLQTRRRRFDVVGRAMSLQGFARGLVPVMLYPASLGWSGLALGDTLGRLFGVRPMLSGVGEMVRARLQTYRMQDARATLRRHQNFLRILLPSSLVDATAAALPLPIIARLFGLEAAGEYALVTRIAAAPGALIGNSIADVFHGHFVQWRQTGAGTARSELNRTARRLLAASMIIYVPAALLAPALFPIVFGEQWQRAGWTFAVMAPFLAIGLVVSPLSRVLIVTDRMQYKLLVDGLFLVVPCTVLWFAADRGYLVALTLFAIAGSGVFLVYWLLIRRAVTVMQGAS